MAHKRPGRRRGRRPDPNARRRQTTRAGRRGEIDRGTSALRRKKRALTSREDVELSGPGVLFGHQLIDRHQYDVLGCVTVLLRRIARACGRTTSPAGLWSALLAAASRTAPSGEPVIGDHGARRALERICRQLDGSRALVVQLADEHQLPPVCLRAVEGRLTPRDEVQLELLRRGLDGLSVPPWHEAG